MNLLAALSESFRLVLFATCPSFAFCGLSYVTAPLSNGACAFVAKHIQLCGMISIWGLSCPKVVYL